ncbi:MAG: AbrB/MazE/SpoVT family DNA-binding domain-containing protein [Candidatus Freyarchaeota archaeon]|nr:AbrB/MazE/SpoVT family DNA-binding domain-containing protein [Candidatus Jordarchaeia archaeon]
MSSKVDSKRRVRIPDEVRDALGIKEGDSVRWILLSSKIAGLMVESHEEGEEKILDFLVSLSSKKIKRTGKADYAPITKSDLWLSVQEEER